MPSMARTSRPRPGSWVRKVRTHSPRSAGRPCTPGCLPWSTRGPENFCTGKRPYDAAFAEKARYTSRLYLPHGDVTSVFLPYLFVFEYVAPALNIQRGTSQPDRL